MAYNFSYIGGAAVAAVLIVTSATLPAKAETLRFLTTWGPINASGAAIAQLMVDLIDEATDGEVTVRRFDDSVVPAFEQLQPVASGAFDMLYTNPSFHTGDTVVGTLVDTVTADIDKRHESGLWALIDEAYQSRNLKVIALGVASDFEFLIRDPLPETGDMSGLKIRSTPVYTSVIRALGAVPVQLPLNEVYTAFEKGLIDGTAYPVHAVSSSNMWEVANYVVRPSFGQGTSMILMNLDKWNGLSPELQEKLLEAGRKFEEQSPAILTPYIEEGEERLAQHGIEDANLGEEGAANISLYYNQGIWDSALEMGGEEAASIINFIKDNDLVYMGRED